MKAKYLYCFFLVNIIILPGCVVGKKYASPEPVNNISYRDTVMTDSSQLMKWFELYRDTALETIIKTTLDSNRNLLAAAARIEEAALQTAIIKINLYPQLGYSAQAGGGEAGISARRVAGGIDGALLNAFGFLNWELDIWGKVKHAGNSALAQYSAIVQNRNELKVSLIAASASNYFLLRDLDNRLAITQQTLAGRKEYTKLITERFEKGYVSELDKLQAIQQESITAALIPILQRQIVQTENTLRLLMGMGPGKVARGKTNFDQNLSADIPVGLPSQLLQRRPDIMSAEKLLEAQFEKIGVAQANRFPSFSLTGLLGFASPELSSFINAKGFVANGFGNITGPLFNFGQRKKLVEVEQKRTEQLYYQYQQTVLSAFGDVDNALTYYKTYSEEYEQRKRFADAAEKSLVLTRARYDYGFTSYLEVVITENNLLDAQLQASAALQGRLTAIVLLYKSLGGGW